MFRPIASTLDKKKKDLIKKGERNADIDRVFIKFLDRFFAEYKKMFNWAISYDSENGRVVINTGSKLVAGELSMKIKELAKLLKEEKLRVTQIVIL